ncbi:hypothetical protein JL101_026320 [Skermanella rosea]|uniref:hypothetical protein n=1 Tax=Skermanella rosea TaxID=1817965 RepID=UPI0019345F00|nr:hypothetical protein [Skermanella rosea]UEM03437.1 hypothetical protein JL101_026320 [Skermanella rosea]
MVIQNNPEGSPMPGRAAKTGTLTAVNTGMSFMRPLLSSSPRRPLMDIQGNSGAWRSPGRKIRIKPEDSGMPV